jgi:hypothetical protein
MEVMIEINLSVVQEQSHAKIGIKFLLFIPDGESNHKS